MGIMRKALVAVVALVVLVAVIIGAGLATGVFGAPSVQGIDNRFGSVNETATMIETNVTVDNPNPIGINLGGVTVDYDVSMNDVRMADGKKKGASIGSGESTVSLRTRLRNERIPDWWVTHIENDEQTNLAVEGTVSSSLLGQSAEIPSDDREITTNIEGALDSDQTRPINANRALVSDPMLYLNETSGSWGDVNDSVTEIEMAFVVYNPKSYAVPVSELGYNMTMNDVAVGSGQSENTTVIEPGTTATITTTTRMQNERLDEWWVTHVENNQITELEIAFSARIDLSNAGVAGAEPVEVPLDTIEEDMETDVFGNKEG